MKILSMHFIHMIYSHDSFKFWFCWTVLIFCVKIKKFKHYYLNFKIKLYVEVQEDDKCVLYG